MVKSLLRLSRPVLLILSALTYSLGAGIAHYLGSVIAPGSLLLGLVSVLSLLWAGFLLDGYFRLPFMPLEADETPRIRGRYRIILLQASFAALALSILAVLILVLTNLLNLSAGILFILIVILLIAYAVPPTRISTKGYGELALAVTVGSLLPGLAFILQFGKFHRLLSFSSFPITMLALAYLLVCDFPTFATDQKFERHSLLTRLSWQRAIPIHHFLVLAAFLFLGVAPFLGIPWSLVGPAFLALPFAAIQIYWLQRIANGGKPLWQFLVAIATATFGLSAYLLALTFWIR
jgi:1,4-dihydroxy-2-naphthoate polyprenyltransferase